MGELLQEWADQIIEHPLKDNEDAPSTLPLVQAAVRSQRENPWFTAQGIADALKGLAHMLRPEAVQNWAETHNNLPKRYTGKKVGIVAAGNIPMVGFHDVLCTVLGGHEAVVKLSNQDQRLLPALFASFEKALPDVQFDISWHTGRLPKVDAMIATGSNNTARYFEYYFGKQPHIIRKNRNSMAILTGSESEEQLRALGEDIFSYFGLGCRNVSKLYVHEDFEIKRFFEAIYPFHDIVNHHKYANNYDYYKALWLMNSEDLLDNGFLLLRPTEAIASPPGVVFYERYSNEEQVRRSIAERSNEVQCVVSLQDVPFGKSQKPELWDYADGVDTMGFLLKL